MSRGRVCWRVAFAASSIALVLAGRSPAVDRARAADPPSAGQAAVIRYLSYHGYVRTFEIAEALGWLRDKGIRIESEGYSQGGPESLAAMASGSIDLAGAATPAIINALAGGARILGVIPGGGIDNRVSLQSRCRAHGAAAAVNSARSEKSYCTSST